MSVSDRLLFRKRAIIETVNDELKNIAQVEHSGHRCFENFIINLLGGIASYCPFPKKPCINLQRTIDTQLALFWIRRTHVNMKNRLMDVHDKIMLRKRSIIETINGMLKNVAQIVHTRHRSVSNFIVNLLAGMAAYAFYDTKLSINMEFEMEGETEVKQLTLF